MVKNYDILPGILKNINEKNIFNTWWNILFIIVRETSALQTGNEWFGWWDLATAFLLEKRKKKKKKGAGATYY